MRYFYTILGYLVVISVFAVNEDTPNLRFENGDFEVYLYSVCKVTHKYSYNEIFFAKF